MPEILQLVEVFPGKIQVLLSCGHRVCCDKQSTWYDLAGKGSHVACVICCDRDWRELVPGALYYVRYSVEPYSAENIRFVSYLPDRDRAVFRKGSRPIVVWENDVFSIQEIPTL